MGKKGAFKILNIFIIFIIFFSAVNLINAEDRIFLSSIIVDTSESWNYNVDNEVLIQTLGIEGNLTDVDSLDFIIDPSLDIIGEIVRIGIGKYKGIFSVENESITNFTINFIAKEKDKFVNEEVEITLIDKKLLDKGNLKKRMESGIDRLGNSILPIIIVFLAIILISLFLNKKGNR